jgi:PKD repeat protein
LQLSVSDSALTTTDTLTVTVTQNIAPVIDSGPTAQPATVKTGDTITFTALAHDPDGDTLDYWWDFGDGNYDDGTSVTNVYTAPGVYTVTLHVDDGIDETDGTVKVTITGNPIFDVSDLQFTVDFSGQHHSGAELRGTLGGLPKGANLNGMSVALNAGGAQATFTLNAKGTSKNAGGAFSLKPAGKAWKFAAQLTSAAIEVPTATNGNAFGLSNTACTNVAVVVPVTLSVGPTSFQGNKTVHYSTAKDVAKGNAFKR